MSACSPRLRARLGFGRALRRTASHPFSIAREGRAFGAALRLGKNGVLPPGSENALARARLAVLRRAAAAAHPVGYDELADACASVLRAPRTTPFKARRRLTWSVRSALVRAGYLKNVGRSGDARYIVTAWGHAALERARERAQEAARHG